MPTTRSGIIDALAAKSTLSREQLDQALTALREVIEESLAAGEPVKIPGLFSVERVERAERMGRNPRTGEPLLIAAGHSVKMTAHNALKRAVVAGGAG